MSVAIWEKRAFSVTVPPHADNGLLVVVTDNQGSEPRVQRVTGTPGSNVGFNVEAPPSASVVVSIFGVDANNQLGGAQDGLVNCVYHEYVFMCV